MLFKVLNEDGTPCNGGSGRWNLPTRNEDGTWTSGEWMPEILGELVPCENGYHFAVDVHILEWLGPAIYEAEIVGDYIDADNKRVARQSRLLRRFDAWNKRIARLFAVWCARQTLAIVPNPDPRSIAACDVAERYANGQATDEELNAAWAAAWDAARDAATAAARDAAWDAARDATRAAARDAAWAAARDATRDAAWDAAGDAQYQHLMEMIDA